MDRLNETEAKLRVDDVRRVLRSYRNVRPFVHTTSCLALGGPFGIAELQCSIADVCGLYEEHNQREVERSLIDAADESDDDW